MAQPWWEIEGVAALGAAQGTTAVLEYVRALGHDGLKEHTIQNRFRKQDWPMYFPRKGSIPLPSAVSRLLVEAPSRIPALARDGTYFAKLESVAGQWQDDNPPTGFFAVDLSHETGPVSLVISSDWHIGAKASSYAKLRADIAAVVETPGAYAILAGDLIHNHKRGRKSGNALYDTLANPDEQWDWLDDIAAPLIAARKIVGVTDGNHEMFDFDEAGVHLLRGWADRHHLPYWRHGGTVRFTVGAEQYYGAIRHQFPGASSINTSNNQRRLYDTLRRPVEAAHLDFIYLGHLHYNDLHQAGRAAGECHYLRGGAYLSYNEWADERFGAWRTSAGAPVVILDPHKHDVLSFRGNRMDLGLRVHRMLREGAP